MTYILGILTGLLIGILIVLVERKGDHRLTDKIAERLEPAKKATIIKEPVNPHDKLIDLLNYGETRQTESDDTGDD